MKNIELKISLRDDKKLLNILKKIGATYKGELNQIDIYYHCENGRLKVREINNKNFELIFYQRPNTDNLKISNYQIVNIKKNQIKDIKSILNNTYREKMIVRKKRKLWIYKNTRIHLDKVYRLGKFLELETVINRIKIKEAKKENKKIINLLNITKYKKYKESYSDLILKK